MKKELGVYIHIPFCIKKCAYCDFLSGPATLEVKQQYQKALLKEIRQFKEQAKTYEVKSIFFGGGTPSSIPGEWISEILNAVKETFCLKDFEGIEVSLEMNPGTVTEEKLRCYKEAGINRLSIGLQSADNEELKLLGRIHTFEQFKENYLLARACGFQNINIDLMSALPGQTKDSYNHTLNCVLALNPEHISAYSLIVEEGTPFYEQYGEGAEKEERLPDESEDREMYHRTKEVLKNNGYERYEISNYAKPGYECRHNSFYWTGVDYVGFGTGASSYLNGQRYHNEEDITIYMNCVAEEKDIKREVTPLSELEKMEEFMFLGLRMTEGVSCQKFKKLFGRTIHESYGDILEKLIEEKLIVLEQDKLRLTELGLDVSNYVMTFFLHD